MLARISHRTSSSSPALHTHLSIGTGHRAWWDMHLHRLTFFRVGSEVFLEVLQRFSFHVVNDCHAIGCSDGQDEPMVVSPVKRFPHCDGSVKAAIARRTFLRSTSVSSPSAHGLHQEASVPFLSALRDAWIVSHVQGPDFLSV